MGIMKNVGLDISRAINRPDIQTDSWQKVMASYRSVIPLQTLSFWSVGTIVCVRACVRVCACLNCRQDCFQEVIMKRRSFSSQRKLIKQDKQQLAAVIRPDDE